MIYIKFVELDCLMLHAKFQSHRPSGSGKEDFLKVLLFIAMAAMSCDLNHSYKLSLPLPNDAPHKVWL